ncbi:MAG: tetratricopeptide repeat protein [bacterium]
MGEILSKADGFVPERQETEEAIEPESVLEESEALEIERLLSEMVTVEEDLPDENEEEEEEPAYPEEELAIEDLLLRPEEGFSLEDEGSLTDVKLSGEESLETEEPLQPEIPQEPAEESIEDFLGGEEAMPEEPLQPEIQVETPAEESMEDILGSEEETPLELPLQPEIQVEIPAEESLENLLGETPLELPEESLQPEIQVEAPVEESLEDILGSEEAMPEEPLQPEIQAEAPAEESLENILGEMPLEIPEEPLQPEIQIEAPAEESLEDLLGETPLELPLQPEIQAETPTEESLEDLLGEAPLELPEEPLQPEIQAETSAEESIEDLWGSEEAMPEEPLQPEIPQEPAEESLEDILDETPLELPEEPLQSEIQAETPAEESLEDLLGETPLELPEEPLQPEIQAETSAEESLEDILGGEEETPLELPLQPEIQVETPAEESLEDILGETPLELPEEPLQPEIQAETPAEESLEDILGDEEEMPLDLPEEESTFPEKTMEDSLKSEEVSAIEPPLEGERMEMAALLRPEEKKQPSKKKTFSIKKRYVVIPIIIAIAAIPVWLFYSTKNTLEKGLLKVSEGKTEEAEKSLDKGLQFLIFKKEKASWYQRFGEEYKKIGRSDLASKKFSESLSICPTDRKMQDYILNPIIARKEYKEVEEIANHILEKDPRSVSAHIALAKVALAKEKPETAINYLKNGALKIKIDDIPSLSLLMEVYFDEKKYAELISIHRLCIDTLKIKKPLNPKMLTKAAEAFISDQKLNIATPVLEEVVRGYPEEVEARYLLASVRVKEKRTEEAKKEIAEVFKRDSKHPLAHNLLGKILRDEKEYAGALKHFLAAVEKDPNLTEAHLSIADLSYLHFNDYLSSIKHYNSALTGGLTSEKTLYSLGASYYFNGEYEKSANIWGRLDKSPELLCNIGNSHLRSGKLKVAEGEYKESAQLFKEKLRKERLSPSDRQKTYSYLADTYNNIGLILELKGETERAQDAYFDAVNTGKLAKIEHREGYQNLINLLKGEKNTISFGISGKIEKELVKIGQEVGGSSH